MNFGLIQAFFYQVNVITCNLYARAKVKGYRELKIEANTSFGKLVEPIQIWVIPCQINKWLPPHHLRIGPKKYISKYLFKNPYPENLNLIG